MHRALLVFVGGLLLATRAAAFGGSDFVRLISVSKSDQLPKKDVKRIASHGMSDDGRFVVFSSFAGNLVADHNQTTDVFVKDTVTGRVEIASLSPWGTQLAYGGYEGSISGDGRYVTFLSASPEIASGVDLQIFVRDRQLGTTELISQAWNGGGANARCQNAVMNRDGRFVLFTSEHASNLVNDGRLGTPHTYLRDRLTGITERIDVDNHGTVSNGTFVSRGGISADGRFVSFADNGTNFDLAQRGHESFRAYIRDRKTNHITKISAPSKYNITGPSETDMSGNGKVAVYVGDHSSIWRYDRITKQREDLTDSVRQVNTTLRIYRPLVSSDGRYVAFEATLASLPWPGKPQLYRYDAQTRTAIVVSASADGTPWDRYLEGAAMNRDGRYFAFWSLDHPNGTDELGLVYQRYIKPDRSDQP